MTTNARLDALLGRLLAPRPEERLASAFDLLDLLPRYATLVSAIDAKKNLLNLEEAKRRWRHINGWKDAMNHLAIAFEERIAAALR